MIIPKPLPWQDPQLYIVDIENTGALVWCDGVEAWNDDANILPDEWDELFRRLNEQAQGGPA